MLKLLLMSALFATTTFASISIDKPAIKFTGYKFLDKTPVSGTFKKVEWQYPKKAENFKDLLMKMSFKVDSYSIDAGKAARNLNITKSLFKTWGNQYISGKVKNVDTKTNTAIVEMKVGDKSFSAPFNYTKKGNTYLLNSTIDLIDIGFKASFMKLSKQCAPFHKGTDGKTKTWSEVALQVTLSLKK